MVISIGFYSDFNGIYGGSMGYLWGDFTSCFFSWTLCGTVIHNILLSLVFLDVFCFMARIVRDVMGIYNWEYVSNISPGLINL